MRASSWVAGVVIGLLCGGLAWLGSRYTLPPASIDLSYPIALAVAVLGGAGLLVASHETRLRERVQARRDAESALLREMASDLGLSFVSESSSPRGVRAPEQESASGLMREFIALPLFRFGGDHSFGNVMEGELASGQRALMLDWAFALEPSFLASFGARVVRLKVYWQAVIYLPGAAVGVPTFQVLARSYYADLTSGSFAGPRENLLKWITVPLPDWSVEGPSARHVVLAPDSGSAAWLTANCVPWLTRFLTRFKGGSVIVFKGDLILLACQRTCQDRYSGAFSLQQVLPADERLHALGIAKDLAERLSASVSGVDLERLRSRLLTLCHGDPDRARRAMDDARQYLPRATETTVVQAALARFQAAKVFLSYRRLDSRETTERIYDALVARYGKVNVFKDADSIPVGADFRAIIGEAVTSCDVLLAVIGEGWLNAADGSGRRRLEDGSDYVRVEIESAFGRSIPIIPLLVGRATMPSASELPEPLRELTFRNAMPVRPDPDFHRDMDRLLQAVAEAAQPRRGGPEATGR